MAGATIAENSALQERIQSLEKSLAELSSSRPAAPGAASLPENFGTDTANVQGATPDLGKLIREAVAEAVNPIVEETQKRKESEQLSATQRASFERAAQAHPDLANADTDLFKTFSALWNNRKDLQAVPGMPEVLAEAARGLLSEARANEQVSKMAAAATRTSAPREINAATDKSVEQVSDALQTLGKVGKSEGWDQDDWGDYLTLKLNQHIQSGGGRTGT